MHTRIIFLGAILALLSPQISSAQSLALAGPSSSCLTASVDPQPPVTGDQMAYRIVFRNACGAPRSFYWCAEHPTGAVPSRVACPRAQPAEGSRDVAADPRYYIQVRKEFIWYLPTGT